MLPEKVDRQAELYYYATYEKTRMAIPPWESLDEEVKDSFRKEVSKLG